MGPVEEDASVVYLRPETARGSYVNFLNVQQTSRQRVPFGIAQLGKAFRNEITPGNFDRRTSEDRTVTIRDGHAGPGTGGGGFGSGSVRERL